MAMMAYNHDSFFSPDVPIARDNDFLQDPALWRDRLPQPYRMIDETLQELLMAVFDEAELRKKIREEQKGMRRVPDVKDASLLMAFPESEMVAVVSSEDTYYIVGCGSLGVHIAELRSGGSLDEQPTDVAHAACEGICGLSVQSRGGAIFIALGTKQEGIKLIAFHNHKLQEVCSIDGVENIRQVTLSRGVSHLAVTQMLVSLGEGEAPPTPQVSLYSLPIDQWLQSLQQQQQHLEENREQQQATFPTPSLFITLTPPTKLTPPTSDPVQIMKEAQERDSTTLPLVNHALTGAYMETRRGLYVSQPHRKDFVQAQSVENTQTHDPLLEFLFFWEGCFSKTSSAMAVVWKRSSSLVVYSLSSKKGNVVPDRVYIQGSYISSMAVSSDSTLICLGLESGNIVLYDIRSGLSWGVSSLSPQQPVSVVLLRPSSETSSLLSRSPVLVAGCEDGSVHCVKWESPTVSYHRRLNRGFECKSRVRNIVFNCSIPTTITTEHENGLVVVWEWSSDCLPLCSLSLPHPFNHTPRPPFSLAAGSDMVLAVGRSGQETSEKQTCNGVFSWSLSSCEPLRKTWINSHAPPVTVPEDRNDSPMELLMSLLETKKRSDQDVKNGISKCWERLELLRRERMIEKM